MNRFLSFLFFACFLLGGCDKVEDSPQPNLFDTLELKAVTIGTVLNGGAEIDLVGANGFKTDVTVSIKTQPKKGRIDLDPNRKIFIYHPNAGFKGYDTAVYQACQGSNCKTGLIPLYVQDTTQDCIVTAPTFNFVVNAGVPTVFINNPSSIIFKCGGKITLLMNLPNGTESYISLDSNRIRVSFPENYPSGQISFTYQICSADQQQCKTGQVNLTIVNYCADLFQPNNDWGSSVAATLSFSIRVDSLLKNDVACNAGADLDKTSFSILTQPSVGTAEISQLPNQPAFLKLKRTVTGIANDSVTYRVCTYSGICKTAKFYYRYD